MYLSKDSRIVNFAKSLDDKLNINMSDKSLLVWGYRNELLKTLDDFIL
jgi:hypothetical protein